MARLRSSSSVRYAQRSASSRSWISFISPVRSLRYRAMNGTVAPSAKRSSALRTWNGWIESSVERIRGMSIMDPRLRNLTVYPPAGPRPFVTGPVSCRAPRNPVRAEGHLRHEGHPDLGPLARLSRSHSERRRHDDDPALRRGRRAARQAGHARNGSRGPVVRPPLASRAQPVEPRSLHWRLVIGIGGGRGVGHGPAGARLRYRRIDPRAGVALRRRRAHADVRPGEPG